MFPYHVIFCRYFPFQLSYWFDWLPYFVRQTEQLQVRVQSPEIQAGEEEEDDGNDVTEGTALLHNNRVCVSNASDPLPTMHEQ